MPRIVFGDNLPVLQGLPSNSVPLIYIDPPFNTGKTQARVQTTTMRAAPGEPGDRTGFQGRRYTTTHIATRSYDDAFDDFLAFLTPRLEEAHRVLAPDGSLFFHIDYREVHYCKVLLDEHLRARQLPERDHLGLRLRRPHHDTAGPPSTTPSSSTSKTPTNYVFNVDAMDRIPYMAPGLVGPEKAARGKIPTDVWWHTIVTPTGREKTGYPTQKPLGVLHRIVAASSRPGDLVLDFFAGSGTTGAAAAALGRDFLLVDNHREALITMAKRFATLPNLTFEGFDATAYQPNAH